MGGRGDLPDPALGVFDTLLVRDGVPLDLDRHLARLTRSVRELYDVPSDAEALGARVLAESRQHGTARVRTTYDPSTGRWTVEATTIFEPGLEPRRLGVRRVPDGVGAHKWVDRRFVSRGDDEDDVLLVDAAGTLLECGTANVFVLVGGQVLTPPLDGRILPGTVRARVLEHLDAAGTPALERAPGLEQLAEADEVFTTSSIRGVQPVVACTGVGAWAVGDRTTWLRASLEGRA